MRAKSERYFCNPHTSGTRKRRPIFRYGQVGEDSFNSCSFHLASSLQVPVSVSVPVPVTFSRIPRKTSSTTIAEENAREQSLPSQKVSRIDPTCRLNCPPPTLSPLLLFSFARNLSRSSSRPRFVKVCVPTFVVRHDTQYIYSYPFLPNRRILLQYHWLYVVSASSPSLFFLYFSFS